MTNFLRRALLAALLLAAVACASGPGQSTLPQVSAPAYRLGAGDEVRVTVFGEPDLTGQYVVSGRGDVSFPLVGEVSAVDKTPDELGAALGELLRQGYVRNPNIAVEVLNFRPFYIMGEVNHPGAYPYSANLTVFNAVAAARGFSYRADQRRIFIKHAGETEERAYRLTLSTPVLPGDTIRVGERHF